MGLISTNPGLRVSLERLERQFRAMCRTPKSPDGSDSEESDQSVREKPFGYMYNLFFWAVSRGADDGRLSPVEGKTDVPFRWTQIPIEQQRKLEMIALLFATKADDPEKELRVAEELLQSSEDERSERLRSILEQLANRGLELMDLEVQTENPDSYATTSQLIARIHESVEIDSSETPNR